MEAKGQDARCRDCPLGGWVVPGDGPPNAYRVIVGQAPADQEVLKGRPFAGKAGGILDEALVDVGVDRSALYITNTVLCQPPGNQSPPPSGAIKACRGRLIDELRQRHPRKVLALGEVARTALTGKSDPIEEMRLLPPAAAPQFGDQALVRVTYHPSGLWRKPERPGHFRKDIAWLREP
jgi:uracil-DNA glycosylase